jgi:hypothetical protein
MLSENDIRKIKWLHSESFYKNFTYYRQFRNRIYENLSFKRIGSNYKFNIKKVKFIDKLKFYSIGNRHHDTIILLFVDKKDINNKKYSTLKYLHLDEDNLFLPSKNIPKDEYRKILNKMESGPLTVINIYHQYLILLADIDYKYYENDINFPRTAKELFDNYYLYIITQNDIYLNMWNIFNIIYNKLCKIFKMTTPYGLNNLIKQILK